MTNIQQAPHQELVIQTSWGHITVSYDLRSNESPAVAEDINNALKARLTHCSPTSRSSQEHWFVEHFGNRIRGHFIMFTWEAK